MAGVTDYATITQFKRWASDQPDFVTDATGDPLDDVIELATGVASRAVEADTGRVFALMEGEKRLGRVDEVGAVHVLDLERVARLRLVGAPVCMAGCWGAGGAAEAFLAAGAAAVVADENEAWARKVLPLGSQALGRLWVRYVSVGMAAGAALDLAKKVYPRWRRARRDLEMVGSVRLLGLAGAGLVRDGW